MLLRQGDDASDVHIPGNSPQAVRLVDETGLPVQLTRIGLSGNTLHGATTDGEWVRALKGAISVEGFFHDDQGQLGGFNRSSQHHDRGVYGTTCGMDAKIDGPLIRRALSDRNNLRVKNMRLGYTATQSHGMSIPAMTNLSFSSSAGLRHSQKRVNADLEYGLDPDKPLRMNLNDTLGSLPSPDLTIDLGDLRVRTQGRSAN